MNNKVFGFFLLLALGFSPLIHAEIELSELPLKAQQAIIGNLKDGKISKIKRQKINLMNDAGEEKPTDLYLARVDRFKGKKFWVVVSKEGQLIDIEDEETEIILEDEAEKKKQKDRKND